jgi:succinyl-CoA synthetase beta subunit
VIVASKQGGMDVEEVAANDPDALFTEPIDIVAGITSANTLAVPSIITPAATINTART